MGLPFGWVFFSVTEPLIFDTGIPFQCLLSIPSECKHLAEDQKQIVDAQQRRPRDRPFSAEFRQQGEIEEQQGQTKAPIHGNMLTTAAD